MLHEGRIMVKIYKSDAFSEAVCAIEKGEYQTAQDILNIVSHHIKEEKNQRIITQYLILNNEEEGTDYQNQKDLNMYHHFV